MEKSRPGKKPATLPAESTLKIVYMRKKLNPCPCPWPIAFAHALIVSL